MLIADFNLGDALLTVLGIFLLVAWFWILISIIGDLFSDHETSGWAKAAWVFFLIFLPFVIIDMVVASVLMSMGMMMLPPVMISLPFKLIFFVLVDGWYLVAGSLVQSFNT